MLRALREDRRVEQRRQREVLLPMSAADHGAVRCWCRRAQLAARQRGDMFDVPGVPGVREALGLVDLLGAARREGSSLAPLAWHQWETRRVRDGVTSETSAALQSLGTGASR